jgi:hypothetical protein
MPSAPAVIDSAFLEHVVAPLRRIPDEFRRFDIDLRAAQQIYGVDGELCEQLADVGVPAVGSGADRLFTEDDLTTVGLYLQRPTARAAVMRCWLRSIRQLAKRGTRYRVDIDTVCPNPRHDGDCRFRVLQPGQRYEEVTMAERQGRVGGVTVDCQAAPFPLPPVLREMAADFGDVRFYLLPYALRSDRQFFDAERVGHCSTVAAVIVDEARRRGMPARTSFGLIVSAPYSSMHNWAEVWFEDRWVKVDPLMANALRDWGIPGHQHWRADWSPADLLYRLSDDPPLVSHFDMGSTVSLPTRVDG